MTEPTFAPVPRALRRPNAAARSTRHRHDAHPLCGEPPGLGEAGGKAIDARPAKRNCPECATMRPYGLCKPYADYNPPRNNVSVAVEQGPRAMVQARLRGRSRDRRDSFRHALEQPNHRLVGRRGGAWQPDRRHAIAQHRAGERRPRGVGGHRPSGLHGWSFQLR